MSQKINSPKAKAALHKISEIYLYYVILALVREGVITRDHLNDKGKLLTLIQRNIKFGVKKMRVGVSLHESFLKFSKAAFVKRDRFVGIVLLAIAIENRLNETIRILAESKGLDPKHVTCMLKVYRIDDKLTWAYEMFGGKPFPKKFRSVLTKIFNIRNQIVHYKSTECHPDDDIDSHSIIEKEISQLMKVRLSVIYDRFHGYTYDSVVTNDKNIALAIEARRLLEN